MKRASEGKHHKQGLLVVLLIVVVLALVIVLFSSNYFFSPPGIKSFSQPSQPESPFSNKPAKDNVNHAPNVTISCPETANVNEQIQCTASARDFDCDRITWYFWTFTDGSQQQAAPGLSTINHTFISPGTHMIKVKVQDVNGLWSEEASASIFVG